MAPVPDDARDKTAPPSGLQTLGTIAATVGLCALLYRGFQFVMEKTVSYIAKRKLDEILKQFEEDAKKSQEAQEAMDSVEVPKSVDGKVARRLLKRNIRGSTTRTSAAHWD